MIFLILLGAELYNAFLARTNMPQVVAQGVAACVSPYRVTAIWFGFHALIVVELGLILRRSGSTFM